VPECPQPLFHRPPGRMRMVLGVAFLACCLSPVACDEIVNAIFPASQERLEKSQAEVAALKAQIEKRNQAEEKRKDAEGRRALDLSICLGEADAAYWAYVKLNGGRITKHEKDGDTVWRARTAVWDSALREKNAAVETCRLLYGRQ